MVNELGPEKASWLLEQAGLQGLESMTPLEGGWDNENFLLRLIDGYEVVLKAWIANDVGEVARVVRRHIHLDSHGIPTTVPLRLLNGDFCAEREGVAWTLIPYVSGGMLGKDEASLKSLGVALSRMSLIPAADCFPREYRMGFSLFDKVLKSKSENVDRDFIEVLSSEVSKLKRVFPENLPLGVLHGDLFPDNVIGCDGEVLAILDLEEAWIGPRAFDLAMAFVGFGWEDGKPVEKRWGALVDGYQSISKLSQEEISALPILYRFATLSIACWRYWKHNLTAPDVSLSGRYVEMLERLCVEFDFSEAFE